ncbi:hypothetical protein ElyMa_003974500 [Elysia marginata]|uniref:Uncharacterized protein n=1 Tax=Elysia marginata TaxID=1093978 RepID=A0AAV4FWX8_9GAST|nr:hypothetical protein ElyMa_003974500 [Elysia marginata]
MEEEKEVRGELSWRADETSRGLPAAGAVSGLTSCREPCSFCRKVCSTPSPVPRKAEHSLVRLSKSALHLGLLPRQAGHTVLQDCGACLDDMLHNDIPKSRTPSGNCIPSVVTITLRLNQMS